MLVRVREDERLRQHAAVLPSDATTLDKLRGLTDDRFQELLNNGTIHPNMGRNDMAVHVAADSPQRDLASGGTRVSRPEIATQRPCSPIMSPL